jgi:hypothetical protein
MDINISSVVVAPSMDAVKLTNKQIFPTTQDLEERDGVTITSNGVDKNTIHFDREEDMIVMCLSTFVHDYVHDYNLGSMHARVIKGNVRSSLNHDSKLTLFEELGINVGNNIFKIMTYSFGGYREPVMYDDSQFADEEDKENPFFKYLNNHEEKIMSGGDISSIPKNATEYGLNELTNDVNNLEANIRDYKKEDKNIIETNEEFIEKPLLILGFFPAPYSTSRRYQIPIFPPIVKMDVPFP